MRGNTPLTPVIFAKIGKSQPLTPQKVVDATAAMTPEQAAQTRQNIGADTPETVAEWLEEHVDPDTGYVIDNSLTIEGAAADAKATGDVVGELKSDIAKLETETHTDLLYGKTATERWYVDPSTGVGRVTSGFYSYEDIDIPAGTVRLFPYNNYSADHKYVRAVSFFTANDVFISGVGGDDNSVLTGIAIPENAAKLSCSLNYPVEGYDGKHYLSTNLGGDINTVSLGSAVEVNSAQINPTHHLVNNIRFPSINFQFDDGNSKDADIVDIFDGFGYKCGFALLGYSYSNGYGRYVTYQDKGYEILSHSTDSAGMSDVSIDPATIETKLKNSKAYLETYGFKIRGFVTPSSVMATVFKPILRKYYQWAATVYFGDYNGTGRPEMMPVDGVYNVWRVSLQGTTLANQKAAVDACIANNGCLTFYGHAASLDTTNYLTTENLTALLTYISEKVSAGKCVIDTPSNCIEQYFAVRNDDVSDGWIPFTSTEAGLDSKLTTMQWVCAYNPKLKLASINIRVKATEDISGQFFICTTLPFYAAEGQLLTNNINRECITYSGSGLLLNGSSTWASGSSYRFTGLIKTT